MTPRQGQPKAAQWEAAFERIGVRLDEIVEREQQKGASENESVQPESRYQSSKDRQPSA
jgi:hypothetical protein